jgi:hypothetical protein
VHQRDDTVDVRIIGEQAGAVDLLRHEGGDAGGAIHRGEDADVVARTRPAAGPAISLESGALRLRQQRLGPRILGVAVIPLEGGEIAIVGVDVLARLDRPRGKADDLAELDDGLAQLKRRRRQLVPARHALVRRDALHHLPGGDGIHGDHHIVRRVEAQVPAGAAGGHGRGGEQGGHSGELPGGAALVRRGFHPGG